MVLRSLLKILFGSVVTLRFLRAASLFMSFVETLNILGMLPFSGVILTMFLSKSTSVQPRWFASPALIAVSFRNWRRRRYFWP